MTSDTILTRGFGGEKERERGRKGEREGELKSSAGKNAGGIRYDNEIIFLFPCLSLSFLRLSSFIPFFIRKGCKQSVKYWNCQIKLGYQNLIEQTLSN